MVVQLPPESYVGAYLERGMIVLVRRDDSGALVERRQPAEYVSFHDGVDDESVQFLRRHPAVRSIRQDGRFVRVGWIDRDARERGTAAVNGEGMENPFFGARRAFEADVHPIKRWFADTGSKIQRPIAGFYDFETDSRVPPARAREGEARILCWTILDRDGRVAGSTVLARENDESERELLRAYVTTALEFDQLWAWNGDEFDLPVLFGRLKRLGLVNEYYRLRRILFADQMVNFRRMNMSAAKSGDEKESTALDYVARGLKLAGKSKFDASKTFQAWKCDSASDGFVRIHGCPGCGERHPEYSPRECLRRYNEHDVRLQVQIENKTGYCELLFTLCELVGVFPDSRGIRPSAQVDAFMLRLGAERGVRFPTARYGEERPQDQLEGAYRTDPTVRGIVRDEHVIDFTRQYPSMITTYNISPETMLGRRDDAAWDRTIPHCFAPGTGVAFRTDVVGILPSAVIQLIELRKVASKRKAACAPGSPEADEWERKDSAYKIAVNSFPGVLGLKVHRLFDADLFESVTQSAAWFIKQVEAAWLARGGRVNCVDTDGAFLLGASRADVLAFVDWCNATLFPDKTREHGAPRCDVAIENEKGYIRIVHVAATRYVGRLGYYKKSKAKIVSKPEIKGLEYKRGDSVRICRRLQDRVMRVLMGDWECPSCVDCGVCREPLYLVNPSCTAKHGVADPKDKDADCPTPELHHPASELVEDYSSILEEVQAQVLTGVLAVEDVAISKRLGKDVDEYEVKKKKDGTNAKQPRHVEIAKKMIARGDDVGEGDKIRVVVVDKEKDVVIPADEFKGECDRHYVWETLVFPPTQRLLAAAFVDVDWTVWAQTRPRGAAAKQRVLEDAGQSTLFSFGGMRVGASSGSAPMIPGPRRAASSPLEARSGDGAGRSSDLRAGESTPSTAVLEPSDALKQVGQQCTAGSRDPAPPAPPFSPPPEVFVRLSGLTSRSTMEAVRGVIASHPGSTPVRIVVDVPGAEVELGAEHLAVTPSPDLDAALAHALVRHSDPDAKANDASSDGGADGDAVRAYYERGPEHSFA